MREMFIGDQPDIMFQLDFPKAVKDWPGTMTLFGSSGAGKTYFLVAMIERYLKSVSTGASIRPIIWLSPEEQIDKTLEPLKKPRWSHYYHGIDISEKAVKESKLSAEEYFGQHVRSVIERHEQPDRL